METSVLLHIGHGHGWRGSGIGQIGNGKGMETMSSDSELQFENAKCRLI